METIALQTTARLAAEIRVIKEQTARTVIYASVQIGRRLEEAKQLVDHGEWGRWLEENVDYSPSTAQNLMRIAREYGSDQMDLSGRTPLEIFGNLTYSQAVALFALPEAERIEFVENNDIQSLSTRELQAAIAEEKALRESAEEKALAADERARKSAEENEQLSDALMNLEKSLNYQKDRAKAAENNLSDVRASLADSIQKEKNRAQRLEQQRAELQAELQNLRDNPPELNDEQREEIERQIEQKYADRINQLTIDADDAKAQREAIAAEKEALERRMQQENDKDLQKFQTLFERLQIDFDNLVKLADDIGGERRKKLRSILGSIADNILFEDDMATDFVYEETGGSGYAN